MKHQNSSPGPDVRAKQHKEARAFAIIVYHALRQQLSRLELEDDLDEKQARAMILSAVNLLPGYEARPYDGKESLILIEKTDDEPDRVSLNIQDAIDSLLIVWRDFQTLTNRPPLRSEAEERVVRQGAPSEESNA